MKSFSKSAAVLAGGLVFAGSAQGALFFEDFEGIRAGEAENANVQGNTGNWASNISTYGSATTYAGSDGSVDIPGAGAAIGHVVGTGGVLPGSSGLQGVLSNAVAIGAGETQWNYDGWHASFGTDHALIEVVWYSDVAGNTQIGIETVVDASVEGTSTTPSGAWTINNWSNYTASGSVAAGAQSFRIIFGGAGGNGNDNYSDNISFETVVPEPGSLALLGLGGLALLRRRR